MNKILVIEDEPNLSRLYERVLTDHHFQVVTAENGEQALTTLEDHHIDLVITDIMMPEMDGFQFTHLIRQSGYDLPILVITAKDSFADKKHGFRLGADDYMVKPVNLEEMLLRVEALLRRAKIAHEQELTVGKTTLNQQELTLTREKEVLWLRNKEFQLLYKLLSYPNKIFTRQQLMAELWGLDNQSDERTVDVHIKRLREQLQRNPDFNIVTIRGLGYKAVLTYEA